MYSTQLKFVVLCYVVMRWWVALRYGRRLRCLVPRLFVAAGLYIGVTFLLLGLFSPFRYRRCRGDETTGTKNLAPLCVAEAAKSVTCFVCV